MRYKSIANVCTYCIHVYGICMHTVNCRPPRTWGSGVLVEYNSTTLGSVTRYHCNNKDHELKGPEIVSCLANGTWSEVNNECTGL